MIQLQSYNPSILRYKNRLLLSYRQHSRKDWRTALFIAELDEALKPISVKPIIPPDELKDNSHEDCRLFLHMDKLWLSWTVSQWPATEFRAVVAYGALLEAPESFRIRPYYIPGYGANDFTTIQKNWLFISRGEKLFCWYGIVNDEQIVLHLEGAKVEEVFKSKALPWKWGPIHGGAICESGNGSLYHFFNSHTEHRDRTLDRYRIAVAEIAGVAPFDMQRISQRPIIVGEEGYCLDKNPRFKPNVCFVCGAIQEGDGYLLSFGWNDAQCRLIRLTKDDLWDGHQ